jgi:hypothetical protein
MELIGNADLGGMELGGTQKATPHKPHGVGQRYVHG